MTEKRKRTSAKGRFTRVANCLEKYLHQSDGDIENAERFFNDVENAWRNVEEKHEDYISTLDEEATWDAEEKWITEIQDTYHAVRMRYVKFKTSCEVKSELLSKEKARCVDYETFSKLLSNLKSSVQNKYPYETIHRERIILEKQFDVVKGAHVDFCLLSENKDEKLNTDWLEKLISEFAAVSSIADAYLKTLKLDSEGKRGEGKRENMRSNIKMEQMPLPKFYGEARFYHRFKRDFNELVYPHLDTREAAFTLRQCLGENVQSVLGSGDYDLNQIFKRLDEKYGDPSKMVDSIITEIQRFRKIENDDPKRIIDFVNMIERASHDLDSVKMGSEINNTNVVSMIESKLPKYLALNWYRYIHSFDSQVDKSKKFPSFLKYLTTERNALEYGMSDLRISSDRKFANINHVKIVKCLIHKDDSHNTSECSSYLSYTVDQRYELLRDNHACFTCLLSGHLMFECKSKARCFINNCGKYHHVSLHPANRESVNTVCSQSPPDCFGSPCIFPIMRVNIAYTSLYANVLWDCCASISLITEAKARELKLQGTPSEISLTVVGGIQRCIESTRYKVPLVDLQGRVFIIHAYSINTISSNIRGLDFSQIKKFFPEVTKELLTRPKGEVDILIGYNYAAWHPIPEQTYGHLLILSNSFGKCVGGSHPNIFERTEKNENISFIVNLISVKNVMSTFSIIEALGTEFNPPCGRCKCGNCPLGGKNCTIKEERELALIEANLKYSEEGFWVAGYPWVRSAENLPNNRCYAHNLLLQIEKRLKNDPTYAKSYRDQMQDMISRQVARKLTAEEISTYKGPIHYIAHHAVLKPSSKTTPVRIVFNSSANFKGHILNEYWAKGPNVFLNTLFGILIRFRENCIGFMGDIAKMYNSVHIRVPDQHCHRFLWRDMNLDKTPDTYVITRVNMGDRPSGSIASLALRKTAEMKAEEFPEDSQIILTSSYMDDIIDSAENVAEAQRITKNITDILKTGNFHVKHWVISSVNVVDFYADFEMFPFLDGCERVLGMFWSVHGDLFRYAVKLNFSKRRCNVRTEPNLTFEQLDTKIPLILTKRMILSQLNGIFDPLGLVSPFIIKGKMLIRCLWITGKKIGWDDKVSDEMRKMWVNFFKEMFELPLLSFKRSVKPAIAVKNPILIIFSDASNEAYGACCYIRWELVDGTYSSKLLLAKSKIAPVKALTIVRLELLAAVISVRLRVSIQKECRYTFDDIIHIVDSEIVRAMVQRESYGFNTFSSTKIGEIQGGSSPEDWYWVSGECNVADVLSRGEKPANLNVGSKWQNGPDFLNLPFEDWPIRKDCLTEELPEQRENVMHISLANNETIQSERFGEFGKLIRVTARVLSVLAKPHSFKKILLPVTVEKYDAAVEYWVKESQRSILDDLRKGAIGHGKLRKLCPVLNEDGIYVVGGRAARWFEASFNKCMIPILPNKHKFSKLYAEMNHRENHAGVDSDIAKIRLNYWIIGLQQMCKSINYKCINCRKKRLNLSSQIMGKLPMERLKPAPPWNSVGIDLFGPFEVRGEVNKRTTGKAYGVIFCCLPSTAVYLDIATDYSTDAFLMVLRRFVSLRGYPSNIYSDSGTQLIGASNVLKSISQKWNWEKIEGFGVSKGINWNFSPGDAPWWNGCCESLIKSIKKSICQAVGNHRVSFSELQTIVFEAANLANERPIGIKPDSYSEHSYLCPNDLLLGRASQRAPHGPWDETKNIAKRFHFIQEITDLYWRKWTLCYFPNLIIQHKWHHEKRNAQVGDIVIIADKHLRRGEWKLGRISKVEPGIDNKVRRVIIQYKNKDSNIFTEIERPIQRVVIILPVDE